MPKCSVRSGWSTWKFSRSQARPYTVILAMTVKAYLGERAAQADAAGRAQPQAWRGHIDPRLPSKPGTLQPALNPGVIAEATPPRAHSIWPGISLTGAPPRTPGPSLRARLGGKPRSLRVSLSTSSSPSSALHKDAQICPTCCSQSQSPWPSVTPALPHPAPRCTAVPARLPGGASPTRPCSL